MAFVGRGCGSQEGQHGDENRTTAHTQRGLQKFTKGGLQNGYKPHRLVHRVVHKCWE